MYYSSTMHVSDIATMTSTTPQGNDWSTVSLHTHLVTATTTSPPGSAEALFVTKLAVFVVVLIAVVIGLAILAIHSCMRYYCRRDAPDYVNVNTDYRATTLVFAAPSEGSSVSESEYQSAYHAAGRNALYSINSQDAQDRNAGHDDQSHTLLYEHSPLINSYDLLARTYGDGHVYRTLTNQNRDADGYEWPSTNPVSNYAGL